MSTSLIGQQPGHVTATKVEYVQAVLQHASESMSVPGREDIVLLATWSTI